MWEAGKSKARVEAGRATARVAAGRARTRVEAGRTRARLEAWRVRARVGLREQGLGYFSTAMRRGRVEQRRIYSLQSSSVPLGKRTRHK